jgi:hypothetical protein
LNALQNVYQQLKPHVPPTHTNMLKLLRYYEDAVLSKAGAKLDLAFIIVPELLNAMKSVYGNYSEYTAVRYYYLAYILSNNMEINLENRTIAKKAIEDALIVLKITHPDSHPLYQNLIRMLPHFS